MHNRYVSKNLLKLTSGLCMLALYVSISLFVTHNLFLSEYLIGRSLDSTVPPTHETLLGPIHASVYTWSSSINGGGPNIFSLTLLPINSILYAPLLINSTPELMSKYQIVLSLTLAMFFFYFLAKHIIRLIAPELKYQFVLAFLGSILFTLNNFYFSEIIFGSNIMYASFSFFPLMLLFLSRYLKTQTAVDLFLLILSLTIIASAIQYLVVAYLLIIAVLIYTRKLKYSLKIFLPHILICTYWVLPVSYLLSGTLNDLANSNYEAGLRSGATAIYSAVVNADYFGNRLLYTASLNSKMLSALWFINAYLLLILYFLPSYKTNKNGLHKKVILGTIAVLLLSIFLVKGSNLPFGEINLQIYREVAIMSIFRSLQRYISIFVITTTILYLISSIYVIRKSQRLLIVLIFMVLINAMPWWYTKDIGRVNVAKTGHPGIGLYKLGPGEEQMYGLVNSKDGFATLAIPPGNSVFFQISDYNPLRTQGSDPGLFFGKNKNYFTEIDGGNLTSLLNRMEKDMYTDQRFVDNYQYIFALLNIKNIVIRKHVTPTFSRNAKAYNLENVYTSIYDSDKVEKIEDYPTISITTLKPEYTLPLFYTPTQCIDYKGNLIDARDYLNEIKPVGYFMLYDKGFSLFQKKRLNCEQLQKTETTTDYVRVNPTKYNITIQNGVGSLPIVFLETYDQSWKVYVKKENKLAIPKENHFVANGYANGWIIDTQELCEETDYCTKNPDGTYNIELIIEFWPQRLFYVGAIISVSTLVLCTGYVIFSTVKERKKKKYANTNPS